MDIHIRHAEARDNADLKALLTDQSVLLATMRLPYVSDANIQARFAPKDGTYTLVAETGGTVVGVALLSTFPNIPRHNHLGEIDLLAVRSDFHGRGIGKALLGAVLDLADNWLQLERTGLMVWQDNTRAMALYRAFGFEGEGTIRGYARRPGGFADAHVMGRLSPQSRLRTADVPTVEAAL